jgi:gamma-glutamyltranspeptidase/glutathione hydrolase
MYQAFISVKSIFLKSSKLLTVIALSSWPVAALKAQQNTGTYNKGMVVCAYPDAAKAGLAILKKGGNAVDAAVAVQFALAVTLPQAGNIGGGGFMVFRPAKGQPNTLDFREKAPALASANMYLDASGNVIPNKSLYTHQAAGVPGSVDGMVQAHKKYGKLAWAQLLQPAIDLARKGFVITEHLANDLNRNQADFTRLNVNRINYFSKSTPWEAGDLLVLEDLAKTLTLIRDKGRAGFYEGTVAAYITAEMKAGQGMISQADLNNYHAVWRKPVVGQYKQYKVITMPPPSSGGIALLQLLRSVEPFPLSRWGHNQDSTVQLITEAERRVYADRSKYLGDPDFFKVPVDSLLYPAYITGRMNNFNWAIATPSSSINPGSFAGYESDQTTH